MNALIPILGVIGLGLVTSNSSSSKKIKKSKVKKEDSKYDVKLNDQNILKYYSKDPIKLSTIPSIFDNFTDSYKKYYQESFIFIVPELAVSIWSDALILMQSQPDKYIAATKKDADVITKELLMKYASDVYWKEGLIPYIYGSPFFNVWTSTNYLIRIAYALLTDVDPNSNYAPGNIMTTF